MDTPKRHLLISGTGRAGTSFLVEFLTELGLETTLSRHGGKAYWDENAEAGLEEMPILNGPEDLPYVIKHPASAEILRQIVSEKRASIDALILPIRRIGEAAASRCVLEARALHEHAPWRTDLDDVSPTHGVTPGGVLFSLHPIDEARILAMHLHELIRTAVEAEIPVCFVAYPRLVVDPGHLWRSIRAALPTNITEEQAAEAHRKTSKPTKVRVGDELSSERHVYPTSDSEVPTLEQVDNIALRREIRRLRKKIREDASENESCP